jgi:hypothetical protein
MWRTKSREVVKGLQNCLVSGLVVNETLIRD